MHSIQLLIEEVKQIKDYRKPRGQPYRLHNLLSIIILSVIAEANDYVAISEYCKRKKDFLQIPLQELSTDDVPLY